jgi:hypothetical protein
MLADNLMFYLLQIRDENKRYRLAGGKGCKPVHPLANETGCAYSQYISSRLGNDFWQVSFILMMAATPSIQIVALRGNYCGSVVK